MSLVVLPSAGLVMLGAAGATTSGVEIVVGEAVKLGLWEGVIVCVDEAVDVEV